ncbi:HNH endonuclease signature motif containing protein [Mycobacterium camsae]|uniref:HNH endonuclease signature motif containing protein n=1 Tax=Mycobacterium gordonae TaxID=1778 RepID=UPI003D6635CA
MTAGGTLLPISDVRRLASPPAYHYSPTSGRYPRAIIDKEKTLARYHGKRLASPEQRLALLGRDGGCTRPGCTVPGYGTQVHHVRGWFNARRTHIDELTLACGRDNRMVERHNYATRRNIRGFAEWIPPKPLDFGRPRTNCMHQPKKFRESGDDDEDG